MNGQELRTRLEEQVSLEKTAHQHVTDMVLADCVEKEFLQTAVRILLSMIIRSFLHSINLQVVSKWSIRKLMLNII